MAKDYRRKCPDCYGTDFDTLFGNKGDGKCSHCHGEGKQTDIILALAGPILGFDTYEPCDACSGTGQCQTCGGTGYEYYDDEPEVSSSQESYYESTNLSDSSYSSSFDSDYSDSSDSVYSSPSSSSETSGVNIFGGIIVLVIIAAVGLLIYNLFSDNKTSQDLQPKYKQEEIVTQPQIKECESNNTGDYSFTNKTSRTIYIFIKTGTWWKTIEVKPKQTAYEYNLMAIQYSYTYGYYNKELYEDDVRANGSITVEMCNLKNLDLILPASHWYILLPNVWKEISIPPGGNYELVMPYKRFMIRFSENDIVHYGYSYAGLPDSARKIYLKSDYDTNIEVSIHPVPKILSNQ